jgi:putative endonuclease
MQKRIYYTYIVSSASRTIYVGVTNNLERRVQEHKDGTFRGFTAKYRCHRLVWFERYSWIGQAIAREKELKGWRRAKKVALIQQENPTWVDLSEEWGTEIVYEGMGRKAGPSSPSFVRMTIQ